jgi:hypothetical protein
MQGPPNEWRFSVILADAAQVAEGKLSLLGGGWQLIGPNPSPIALGVIVGVPWTETNRRHTLAFKLLDGDGKGVILQGGTAPLEIQASFELGRPPGISPGTRLNFPMAFNLPSLNLSPGTYEWAWSVDNETREEWRLAFAVRSA